MDDMFDFFRGVVGFGLGIVVTVFVGFLAILLGGWIIAGFEYKAWNQLHGTNYTQYQWFAGSEFIEKYHYPNRNEATKSEVKLNVN